MYHSRLHLGVNDLAVESVFRTVDGFVIPWANWVSSQPSGTAGNADGTEDSVVRAVSGKWNDDSITATRRFYCEGKRPFCTASTAIFVFSSLKSHFEGKIVILAGKISLDFQLNLV